MIRNCDKCGKEHDNVVWQILQYDGYEVTYFLCNTCWTQLITYIGQYYESRLK